MNSSDIIHMFDCIKNIFDEEFVNIKNITINFHSKCFLLNELLKANKEKYTLLESQMNKNINTQKLLNNKLNISKNILLNHSNEKIESSIYELETNIKQNEIMIETYKNVLDKYSILISSFKKEIDEYYYSEKLNN